jgi:hypothetical protein
LAGREAFDSSAFSKARYLGTSALTSLVGFGLAGAGRVVEAVAPRTQPQEHVNEIVRQIGNDMSYVGVAGGGIGLATTVGIARGWLGRMRSFDAGWDEATKRLDPVGQIEDSLRTELSPEE